MSQYYGEKKYKEPDDLNATYIMHKNWDRASGSIAAYFYSKDHMSHTAAVVNFLTFYSQTVGELKHRGAEIKGKGFEPLKNIGAMPPEELFQYFNDYQQLLVEYGVISFQKQKDSSVGGHSGPE